MELSGGVVRTIKHYMRIRTKIEHAIEHIAQVDSRAIIEVYLNARDFEDFQEEVTEYVKTGTTAAIDAVVFAYSSRDEILMFQFMGFKVKVSRNIFVVGLSICELGDDGQLYARSVVTYERGYPGKEAILL